MDIINNATKTLIDDLQVAIKKGSRVSIAAASFSIYAYHELKKVLSGLRALNSASIAC